MSRSFVPKTLWGRTLAVTIVAVLVAEILTLVSFNVFVLVPEMNRLARATAASVVAVAEAVDSAGPEDRGRLIARLQQIGWLEIRSDTLSPDAEGRRPLVLERVFMTALAEALSDREDLFWRTDRSGRLWVHLTLGGDGYWVGVRSLPRMGIVGLFALCAAISAALSALVATQLTSGLLKPLEALRRASGGLTLAALPEPLPETGPADLAAVTRSFNLMTHRLKTADAERRMVLAGISHDVRTPLTKLRLALAMMEGSDPDLRQSAERQLTAIERILSQFLTFARGYTAEPSSPVSIRSLMSDLAARFAPEGLEVEAAPDLVIEARPEALHRALGNLVENALRYGTAPVTLVCEPQAEDLTFIVADLGPGIPEPDLDRMRQPFVRGDAARSADGAGTGLGLAIVEEIARLHGGRLEFAWQGARFEARLCLPLERTGRSPAMDPADAIGNTTADRPDRSFNRNLPR